MNRPTPYTEGHQVPVAPAREHANLRLETDEGEQQQPTRAALLGATSSYGGGTISVGYQESGPSNISHAQGNR